MKNCVFLAGCSALVSALGHCGALEATPNVFDLAFLLGASAVFVGVVELAFYIWETEMKGG